MFEPFSKPLYSEFFWAGENQKAALGGMRKNILANNQEGVLLLIGEEGHGKTTLVDILVSRIQNNVTIGRVIVDPEESSTFLNSICRSFGLNNDTMSKIDFYLSFTSHLNRLLNNTGKKSLLIVQNGEHLTEELLEDLAQIAGMEYDGRKLISILLVGDQKLMEMIESSKNSVLKNNLLFLCKTNALSKEDSSRYITHRLKIAGNSSQIFTDEAMERIFEITKGNLGEINTLCTQAISIGSALEHKSIDTDIIDECIGVYKTEDKPPIKLSSLSQKENDIKSADTAEPAMPEEAVEAEPISEKMQSKKSSALILFILLMCSIAALFTLYPKKSESPTVQQSTTITKTDLKEAKPEKEAFVPAASKPAADRKENTVAKPATTIIIPKTADDIAVDLLPTPKKSQSSTDAIRIQPMAVNEAPVLLTAIEHTLNPTPMAEADSTTDKKAPSTAEVPKEQEQQQARKQSAIIETNKLPVIQQKKETVVVANEQNAPAPVPQQFKTVKKQESIKRATPPSNQTNKPAVVKTDKVTKEVLHAKDVKVFHMVPKQLVRLEAKPNSNYVTQEAMEALRRYASLLQQSPETRVLIEGFIASNKSSKENTRLSERRANIVKDYMLKQGVSQNQLKVVGRGNEKPLASNSNPSGRKKNRRIELSIINDPAPITK